MRPLGLPDAVLETLAYTVVVAMVPGAPIGTEEAYPEFALVDTSNPAGARTIMPPSIFIPDTVNVW